MDVIRREARLHDDNSDTPAPIIEISLKGHLGFKNSLLDLGRLRDEARAMTGALHVMVRNQSVPVEYAVAAGLDADTSRPLRERRIIEDLIARDTRFRDRARDMAGLVIEAKRLALSDEPPEAILDLIEQKLEPGARRATNTQTAGEEATATVAASAGALQAIERNAAT
jgi:hypothetical protein